MSNAEPKVSRNVETLLTPAEAAELLRVSVQSLANWRCSKRHPLNYVKLSNRKVMYRLSDIQAFINNRTVVVNEY